MTSHLRTRFSLFVAGLLSVGLVPLSLACSPDPAKAAASPAREFEALAVEASCGSCQFGLPGNECELAVRIDGRAHLVDGAKLDDHGDAHAADGFCNAVRQAKVSGRLEGERFVATSFELLPR